MLDQDPEPRRPRFRATAAQQGRLDPQDFRQERRAQDQTRTTHPDLRGLVGDLHEADMGALIEALAQEQRPRLVALLGIDFDFTALTEVDDAVRDEILEELPPQAVAKGVSELGIRRRRCDPRGPAERRAGRDP